MALEALREQETLNQIAARYDVLPVQVSQWKNQLLSGASESFARKGEREKLLEEHSEKESRLYQKIDRASKDRFGGAHFSVIQHNLESRNTVDLMHARGGWLGLDASEIISVQKTVALRDSL